MPPVFLLGNNYGANASITVERATTVEGLDPNDMLIPTEERGWAASVMDPTINTINIDRDFTEAVNILALLGNSEMANMKVVLETSSDDFTNNSYFQQPWNYGLSAVLDKSEMTPTSFQWFTTSDPTDVGGEWEQVGGSSGYFSLGSTSTEYLFQVSDGIFLEPFDGVPLLIEVQISSMPTSAPSVHIVDSPSGVFGTFTSRLEIVEDGTYWLLLTPPVNGPLTYLGLQADPGFTGKVEFMRWWRVEDLDSPTFNGVNAGWVNLGGNITDRYVRFNFFGTSTDLIINNINWNVALPMPSFINTDFKNFEVNGTVLESQGGYYVTSNIESVIQVFPLQWPPIKEDSDEFANVLTWSEEVWKQLRPWFIIPDIDEDLIFFVWPPINNVRFSAVLDSKSLKNIRIAPMSCRSRGG